jgi:hypothetical protein
VVHCDVQSRRTVAIRLLRVDTGLDQQGDGEVLPGSDGEMQRGKPVRVLEACARACTNEQLHALLVREG